MRLFQRKIIIVSRERIAKGGCGENANAPINAPINDNTEQRGVNGDLCSPSNNSCKLR